MHWTEHAGYQLLKVKYISSSSLHRIRLNADSLCAVYEKWAILDPKDNRVLEMLFFPYIKIAEVYDLKNNLHLAIEASYPHEAVQRYFHQADKTAEQADKRIESRLQYLTK